MRCGLALKYEASRGAAAGGHPFGPRAIAPHPSVPLPLPGFTARALGELRCEVARHVRSPGRLHARSLGFAHPADGRWFEITSEYPPELQHALDVLHRQ